MLQEAPAAPPPESLSTAYAPITEAPLGRTEPRIFTPPLRELTPETSYGYAVITFARDVLSEPLDPWEEWAVIHAGELLPDGRPRFRHVLILVARQNGKTHLCKVLALFWLFVEEWALILGTSSMLTYAKESWAKARDDALGIPELRALLKPKTPVKEQPAETWIVTAAGCKYQIAAANRRGGRSLSVDRLIQDELREHKNWEAWDAATNAMNARPYAQSFSISNMGDDRAVVLDSLRDSCVTFIETGVGDPRFGLLEWSAPPGANLLDTEAHAYANPNLGRRIDPDVIMGAALRAVEKGGDEEAGFRTEVLCQRVRAIDPAVNPRRWAELHVPGDLTNVRSRVALCVDISPDRMHATLAGAAVLEDGRVRVQVIAAWQGTDATGELRRSVRNWVRRIRPQAFGWMPIGPAAASASTLAVRKGRTDWPPPGVQVEEIRAEVSAVCMGFAALVDEGQVIHGDEPLLNAHVTGATKLWRGDVWVFSRRGEGHCDGAYAAAGAAHLARTLPRPVGKPRIVVVQSGQTG